MVRIATTHDVNEFSPNKDELHDGLSVTYRYIQVPKALTPKREKAMLLQLGKEVAEGDVDDTKPARRRGLERSLMK